ncbi:hypothetical protein AB0B45_10635 [Nonomuraea sp. NPDC049152]|uniref:hypothetical protein n=1 Tax=Nonomuraea sp. NPDC049152 TaxID=3154350 RepID=UPI0033F67F0D
MDLAPYIDRLHQELAVAAETGDEDARALAEHLLAPLDSAARLVLLEALSKASDEITRDLAPGSVEMRLRGRDPAFVVSPGHQAEPAPPRPVPMTGLGGPDTDEGGPSRISLRVPDPLKHRIEAAASGEGLSANAWLVRAATTALDPEGGGRRHTGWVR